MADEILETLAALAIVNLVRFHSCNLLPSFQGCIQLSDLKGEIPRSISERGGGGGGGGVLST